VLCNANVFMEERLPSAPTNATGHNRTEEIYSRSSYLHVLLGLPRASAGRTGSVDNQSYLDDQ